MSVNRRSHWDLLEERLHCSDQARRNGRTKEYARLFEKVAKDEARILNIVQGIMLKSTDFLRRIIAPAGGQGGVTLSYLCPHCNNCSWWCTICGEKYEWRAPNRLLVVPHAVPQGLRENLINALKLLANPQKDVDSPVQSIVAGLCERNRRGIMEGLRNLKSTITVPLTWAI